MLGTKVDAGYQLMCKLALMTCSCKLHAKKAYSIKKLSPQL